MTKADIVSKISKETGIHQKDSMIVIEALIDVIKNSMADGNDIFIRGFGSFTNKKRARKVARNITKNTAVVIPEHFAPKFKPSPVFLEKIKESKKIELRHRD